MSVPAPAPRQRSLAGLARRMLAALLNVYGAFLLVYLLLRMLVGEGFLPVGVASQVLHLLLLPAFIGLPLACWLRRWPAAMICDLGAGLFLVLSGRYPYAPTHRASSSTANRRTCDGDPHGHVERQRASGPALGLGQCGDSRAAGEPAVHRLSSGRIGCAGHPLCRSEVIEIAQTGHW